jgi:hypothetical protein
MTQLAPDHLMQHILSHRNSEDIVLYISFRNLLGIRIVYIYDRHNPDFLCNLKSTITRSASIEILKETSNGLTGRP